ncbi:MAG: hypothetical protein MJ247_03185 [Alphaproteobacteria bacterium]|nr:hypothetical protein [Alphaproteobacteria bacterium]
MRFLVSIVSFFVILLTSVKSNAEVIPMTYGDLAIYKALPKKEKLSFLREFYKKNKAVGATDGEILNEIVKIDEVRDNKITKLLAKLSKQAEDIDDYIDLEVAFINKQIESVHPDKDNIYVDKKDIKTWKNIKNVVPEGHPIKEYFHELSSNKGYSNIIRGKFGDIQIISCSLLDDKQEEFFSGIYLKLNDGYYLKSNDDKWVDIDLSKSKNYALQKMYYPMPNYIREGKFVGYTGEFIIPFKGKILSKAKEVLIDPSFNFTFCKDEECFSEDLPNINYTPYITSFQPTTCSMIQQEYVKVPENNNSKIKLITSKISKSDKSLYILIENDNTIKRKVNLYIIDDLQLKFGKPVISMKNNKLLYRYTILNYDDIDLSKGLDFALYFEHQKLTSKVDVKAELVDVFKYKEKFNLINFMKIVILGIPFVLITPFSLFILSLFFIKLSNSSENSENFFNGLFDSLKIAFPLGLFLCYVPQLKDMLFLNIGVINIFMTLTLLFLIYFVKFINHVNQNEWTASFQKTGFYFGILFACLVLIDPQVFLYDYIYDILQDNILLYGLSLIIPFVIGLCFVFLVPVTAKISNKSSSILRKMVLYPLIFMIINYICLIIIRTNIAIGLSALIVNIVIVVACFKLKDKHIALALGLLLCVGLNLLKFDNANNFDEAILTSDKKVIISVHKKDCFACKLNDFSINYFVKKHQVENNKFEFVKMDYDSEIVKSLLGASFYNHPVMNIILSNKEKLIKVVKGTKLIWNVQTLE